MGRLFRFGTKANADQVNVIKSGPVPDLRWLNKPRMGLFRVALDHLAGVSRTGKGTLHRSM